MRIKTSQLKKFNCYIPSQSPGISHKKRKENLSKAGAAGVKPLGYLDPFGRPYVGY